LVLALPLTRKEECAGTETDGSANTPDVPGTVVLVFVRYCRLLPAREIVAEEALYSSTKSAL
jgi:hypothetical protein